MLSDGQNLKRSSRQIDRFALISRRADSSGDEDDADDESALELSEDEDETQLETLGSFAESLLAKSVSISSSKVEPVQDPSQPTTALSLNDILSSLTDPSLQPLRKSLSQQTRKKSQKLSAPLAKPLKDKLERQAAYQETKTEISKWQPIVQQNRQAEHLSFPLNEPQTSTTQTNATLAGTFTVLSHLSKITLANDQFGKRYRFAFTTIRTPFRKRNHHIRTISNE
jgi:U3 small nucleolar RNA-associated protein 14